MKWIYKGLAKPELGAGGVLLGWHEKVSVRTRGVVEGGDAHTTLSLS